VFEPLIYIPTTTDAGALFAKVRYKTLPDMYALVNEYFVPPTKPVKVLVFVERIVLPLISKLGGLVT
jgi:hypothetical protein